MRIVQLVDTLGVGGAERMAVHLSTGLKARGHDVMVVCLRTPGPLTQPLDAVGIPWLALDKPEGLHWGTLSKLRDALKEYRPDVVHTHNPLVHHYGAFAGRWAGVRHIVSTLHGIGNITGTGKAEIIFGASCLLTNQVVAVCQMAKEHFARNPLIPSRKLHVVYNGIPLEPFLAIPPREPGGEIVFGVAGRLVPIKDHTTALKAFQLVAKEHANCRLEFLGDGVLRHSLEEEARQLGIAGRVVFHGERSDVRSFYEDIDVFVMCSLSEGLPMTLLEAMASARPVVSTAVGGIPEMVDGAACGWLCPPAAPDRLAAALEKALTAQDHQARGTRARQYVLRYGSLEAMVDGYERLFGGPRA